MTMPIRSRSSRSVARCTARLGDRVHPGGGLVEDHHVRVADQDPGERHELLLPGRQHVAAVAEPGLQAVGQLRHPRGRGPARRSAPAGRGEQVRVEQRDVLGERAGQDLGALRDHGDPAAQPLEVEVEQVGAAEEHRAAAARRRRG